MEFPRIVFKCPGDLPRQGGTFKVLQVSDDVTHANAVADGWFSSLPEAIESHDNPKPVEAPETVKADEAKPAPEVSDVVNFVFSASRDELEEKAKSLNIKFDGRTSDAKLARLITEA